MVVAVTDLLPGRSIASSPTGPSSNPSPSSCDTALRRSLAFATAPPSYNPRVDLPGVRIGIAGLVANSSFPGKQLVVDLFGLAVAGGQSWPFAGYWTGYILR